MTVGGGPTDNSMSIQSAPPDVGLPDDVDPAGAFWALIWDNPEVCNNCFSRVRDRTEHDTTADRLGTSNRPDETLERAGDGIISYDAEDRVAFGHRPKYLARTFCGNCGRRFARRDELTHKEAIERVPALCQRLREQHVPVNQKAVYRMVEVAKSREALQGYDTEIFARAVKLGTQRADDRR